MAAGRRSSTTTCSPSPSCSRTRACRPRDRPEVGDQDRQERRQPPSIASVYRALAEAGEKAAADAPANDDLPKRPVRVRIRRPDEPLAPDETELRERLLAQCAEPDAVELDGTLSRTLRSPTDAISPAMPTWQVWPAVLTYVLMQGTPPVASCERGVVACSAVKQLEPSADDRYVLRLLLRTDGTVVPWEQHLPKSPESFRPVGRGGDLRTLRPAESSTPRPRPARSPPGQQRRPRPGGAW